jgi:membrane associated rhomboid family serine protease
VPPLAINPYPERMTETVPTAAILLDWIAESKDRPWFPGDRGFTRDAIDAPLSELWLAGLIEASDWVKGRGQGFNLTAEGSKVAAVPNSLLKLKSSPKAKPAASTDELRRKHRTGPTTFDRGEAARRALLTPPPLVVMPLIVVLNVLVFLIGFHLASRQGPGRMGHLRGEDSINLVHLGALSADTLLRGEGWRLAASAFLHAGIMHLLVNMYSLVVIGAMAEDFWGRRRFLVLYAVSAIAGGCLGIGMRPDALIVGASGAISGITVAVAVWIWLYRQHFDKEHSQSFFRQMGILLVLNVIVTLCVPRVCWEAHLGGAIAGGLLALTLHLIHPKSQWRSIVGILLTFVILAGPLPLLMVAIPHRPAWQSRWQNEKIRQHLLFFQKHAAAIQPIHPSTIMPFVQSSTRLLSRKVAPAELATPARTLAEAAANCEEQLRRAEPTGYLTRRMPELAADYAASVGRFAKMLAAIAEGTSNDDEDIAAAGAEIERRWLALNEIK